MTFLGDIWPLKRNLLGEWPSSIGLPNALLSTDEWRLKARGQESEMIRIKSASVGISKMAVVAFANCVLAVTASAATTTLDNMQAAFNGESNAHARYLAFAAQADREGYGEVASL